MTLIHFHPRFPHFVALMTVLVVIVGSVMIFHSQAHSSSELMEPLPVTLPDRHLPVATSGYVGAQVCAQCHQAEYRYWQDSQHAKAMQPAIEQTVLGDFNEALFTYAGITSTFSHRDGKFITRTDGPDGQLRDYEIAYTFGVYPLQQYLIGFPDGRYQVLGMAWDSRLMSRNSALPSVQRLRPVTTRLKSVTSSR